MGYWGTTDQLAETPLNGVAGTPLLPQGISSLFFSSKSFKNIFKLYFYEHKQSIMLIQNIKLAADAMVFSGNGSGLQLLLIKRKNEPFKGMWAIPGGFVEDDEDLETAAIRELEEETGVRVPSMTQLHTFGKPGRDPRGRTVTVTYWTIADAHYNPAQGSDDAAEAHWVEVASISQLAFDHDEMLEMALRTLPELGWEQPTNG